MNKKVIGIVYRDTQEEDKKYYDPNIIDKTYHLKVYEVSNQEFFEGNYILSVYVDSKNNNNITYNFYTKSYAKENSLDFDPFPMGALYNKQNNTIGDTIPVEQSWTIGNVQSEYWTYQRRYINLGSNYNNRLYIFQRSNYEYLNMEELHNSGYKTNIYFNDQVYYSSSKELYKFDICDSNNCTEVNYNVDNTYISGAISYYEPKDLNWIKNYIRSFEEKKEAWLTLFNSIWENIPEAIQNLLVFIYAMLHCIGIFIIFKD